MPTGRIKAHWYGFHRKSEHFKPSGFPVVDMIRERALAMNLNMIDVDAMAKTLAKAGRERSQ